MLASSRHGGPVWNGIRALYTGRPKPYWVMALAAYFDDSREYSKGGISYHAIAGYLARIDFWDETFSPRWKALIDSAPHPISEFKTSDCRWLGEEFKSWSRQEANDYTVRVIDELVRPDYGTLFGVGSAIMAPHFDDEGMRADFEEFALGLCLHNVMGAICSFAKKHAYEPIHFICDKQPKLEGRLHDLWNLVLRSRSWYGKDLSRLDFEDSKKLPPLQAADILAYETRKDLKDRFERSTYPRSKALHRLLWGQPHIAFAIDTDYIDEMRGVALYPPRPKVLFGSAELAIFREGVPHFALVHDPRPKHPQLPSRLFSPG